MHIIPFVIPSAQKKTEKSKKIEIRLKWKSPWFYNCLAINKNV